MNPNKMSGRSSRNVLCVASDIGGDFFPPFITKRSIRREQSKANVLFLLNLALGPQASRKEREGEKEINFTRVAQQKKKRRQRPRRR